MARPCGRLRRRGAERDACARLLAWTAFTGAPGLLRWLEAEASLQPEEARPLARLTTDETDALCAEALPLYRDAGADDELALVQTALAVAYSSRGRQRRAGELLTDAVVLLESLEPEPRVPCAAVRSSPRDAPWSKSGTPRRRKRSG